MITYFNELTYKFVMLKRIVSIFILIILFIQSSGYLFVVLAFQVNKNYVATTLCEKRFERNSCCKGKCYLNKQIKKEQKNQEKYPDLKNEEVSFFVSPLVYLNQPLFTNIASNQHFFCYNFSGKLSDYSTLVFRPPNS